MSWIDSFLKALGIQDILIVYFNYADQPAVNVLKRVFGLRAKVIKLEAEANILPPEVNQYQKVIVIGPRQNPIINRLIKMGAIKNKRGIYTLGNMMIITGKDPLDTFELVGKLLKDGNN